MASTSTSTVEMTLVWSELIRGGMMLFVPPNKSEKFENVRGAAQLGG
jgi:hypothetical protein